MELKFHRVFHEDASKTPGASFIESFDDFDLYHITTWDGARSFTVTQGTQEEIDNLRKQASTKELDLQATQKQLEKVQLYIDELFAEATEKIRAK